MTGDVLIVDDSLTVRMDLAEAFEAAGLRALPVATLAEARAVIARGTLRLAVLDVLLPDGDGIELLRELRAAAATQGVPVLVLSSETEVHDRVRGLDTGADDYVGKPYDRRYVVARAQELLRRREQPATAGPGTVLVVDDSVTFRETLRTALEGAGYTVLTAESGEEGLRRAAESRPAAMIVDGVIPGIDGATVIRRIRLDAALRGIACLLLTASEDRDAELRALDAGADAFVRKEVALSIILARVAAMLRGVTAPMRQAESLLGPKRVLAVDDSATYLDVLSTSLRGEGYDVILAHSGQEAIELLGAQSVDCILLDVVMPGISGKEACRRIKASPGVREIPLILITAHDESETLIDALSTGADDYIAKSSDVDVLLARVRAQLRRKQLEDEHRRVREQLLRSELDATEARAARELAEARAQWAEELEEKNRELEAFSYSVSHDLRAPLRSIDGFTRAILEDCADTLDPIARGHLDRVAAAARRMRQLVDDLLELSSMTQRPMARETVDLTAVAQTVAEALAATHAGARVSFVAAPGLTAHADPGLLRTVVENLLGNAWKFTGKRPQPRVEIGVRESGGATIYFVRDNGAGFDPAYADKLFRPFQRLHTVNEFPGTGIGLATIRRIVERHGGRVWAEGATDEGATFHFTLTSLAVHGVDPTHLAAVKAKLGGR